MAYPSIYVTMHQYRMTLHCATAGVATCSEPVRARPAGTTVPTRAGCSGGACRLPPPRIGPSSTAGHESDSLTATDRRESPPSARRRRHLVALVTVDIAFRNGPSLESNARGTFTTMLQLREGSGISSACAVLGVEWVELRPCSRSMARGDAVGRRLRLYFL